MRIESGGVRWILPLLCALACRHGLPPPGPLAPAGAPRTESAAELLARAEESFARRPDPDAVRRADALFTAAATADPDGVAGLLGASRAKAWLAEHEQDAAARASLAAAAVDAGQWCQRRAPGKAACDYRLAVALGLQAREQRSLGSVKLMAERLRRAEAADPAVDSGGPSRVLALLLLRAPGWPIGPGDPETALVEARKAVALFPDFPPNQLALAEALAANGSPDEARAAAARALALARERAAAGDPDAPEWVESARKLAGGAA